MVVVVDDEMLASIYHLPHLRAPQDQSKTKCKKYLDLLLSFCTKSTKVEQDADIERGTLESCLDLLEFDSVEIVWQPEYACAWLIQTPASGIAGTAYINLIGLDEHQFWLRGSRSRGGAYDHVGNAKAYRIMNVGNLNIADLSSFRSKYNGIFQKATERKGDKRSAAGGNQGHQRTPAFVHALLVQALHCKCLKECTCIQRLPKGGFTDVGLHTGGMPRDTSWPLARSVFTWALGQSLSTSQDSSSSVEKILLYLDMFILESYMESRGLGDTLSSNDAVNIGTGRGSPVDAAFGIIQSVALSAARLSDAGHDMSSVLADIKTHTASLSDRALEREQMIAETFMLSHALPELVLEEGRNPSVCFEDPLMPDLSALSSSEYQKRIDSNLGWLPLPVVLPKSFAVLNRLMNMPRIASTSDIGTIVLVMRVVEETFWSCATALLNLPVAEETEALELGKAVDKYRKMANTLRNSVEFNSFMQVEQNSREVLLTWLAYCIVFETTRRVQSDVMQGFEVSLNFHDLKHLVLSDGRALEAAKMVACYLKKHERFGQGIFSLRNEEPTFLLGEEYAGKYLNGVWEEEKRDAETRKQKHWEEVQRKQKLARKLRSELRELQRQHDDAEYDLQRATRDYRNKPRGYRFTEERRMDDCQSTVDSLSSRISCKKDEIKKAEAPPPPVVQPLPAVKSKAFRVLFFAYMPPLFRELARMSFTAQQQLLPKPWTAFCGGPDRDAVCSVYEEVKVSPKQSWIDHYNTRQHSVYHSPSSIRTGSDGLVSLIILLGEVPEDKDIGPCHVDHFYSPNDGVWHPDRLKPGMAWCGGSIASDRPAGGGPFNPFAINNGICVSYFTERLPKDDSNLQWALRQPDFKYVAASRGNRPIAEQDARPMWLSKNGYLLYGKIRAFPRMQLRNLCTALGERGLPLTHPAVHTLIRQTLFHLGPLQVDLDSISVKYEWKMDIEYTDIIQTLYTIIEEIATDLKESPHQYKSSALVGELCGFLSYVDASFKSISRTIASSARKWAKDYDERISEADPANICRLRLKQALFYRTAILCLVKVEALGGTDVGDIVGLTVIAHNLFLDELSEDKEAKALETQCNAALGCRIFDILGIIEANKSFLTEAVRAVVQTCPPNLNWKRTTRANGNVTTCFDANGSDGVLYSVNVLRGTVLIDGMPPSSLPESMRRSDIFQRTFGDLDMEVVPKNGTLETVRAIKGRFYRFFEHNNEKKSRLVIQESLSDAPPVDWNDCLELLDNTSSNTVEWLGDLPVYLKEVFSHWINRARGVILFRGIRFQEREVSFIFSESFGCRKIPSYLARDDSWHELLQDIEERDRLILHELPFLNVLAKFEDREHIHTYATQSFIQPLIVKIHLYRFGLTFVLDNEGQFICEEIAGFSLFSKQHILDTFRGFNSYLILQQVDSNPVRTRLLVPTGDVATKMGGTVDILSCQKCSTERHFHSLSIHPRFEYIEAPSIEARLHLAAIHIATSSLLPDPRLHMTGEERALELMRQSWVNRPFTREERLCSGNIKRLCKGVAPDIALLSLELEQSSDQVWFLHTGPTREDFPTRLDEDEATAYLRRLEVLPYCHRRRLTPEEEYRTIGTRSRIRGTHRVVKALVDVDKCPVSASNVSDISQALQSLITKQSPPINPPAFPLNKFSDSKLEEEMYHELEESWTQHCSTKDVTLEANAEAVILQCLSDVGCHLDVTERYLKTILSQDASLEGHWHSVGLRFLRLVNIIPTASYADYAIMACHPLDIRQFNPILSDAAVEVVKEALIIWLELCVLQDKLRRLDFFLKNRLNEDLLRELAVSRTWIASSHPYWLAFEVEGCLQIRTEQYAVAQRLIDNPGDVVQLNMGLGKTRVILPMLVLYWSFQNNRNSRTTISRIHILSQLLVEATEFFHHTLVASALTVKMYTMPFCRDVIFDADDGLQRINTMKCMIEHCRREGGFFLVAPEHRLSLELKAKELCMSRNKQLGASLQDLVDEMPWQNILDEIDEILHHRFQLIYAVGSVQELPQGNHRWLAAQALLRVLRVSNFDMVELMEEQVTSEAFAPFRIIIQDKETDPERFRTEIADELMRNLSHQHSWMTNHVFLEDIKRAITDPRFEPESMLLPEEHVQDVLVLRGLLAADILLHCLLKRHRVDYGIARPGKKRLAIPFRGADTPAERSEFAHPECAIVLTILAYYCDGLSRDEMVEALEQLLKLGPSAKREFYNGWYALSVDRMKQEGSPCKESLDRVEKLDLSNAAQIDELFYFYCKNTRTIDFWLNTCVFPREMQQFEQRMVGNAWHLAHSKAGAIVGFSGTNDNHRLLPLQVRQFFPEDVDDRIWPQLFGTNGKMLDVILKTTIACKELAGGPSHLSILDAINGVDAIIDSGALFAGISNLDIAKSVIKKLPREGGFQGVIFFHNDISSRGWMILERTGRCLRKSRSPVHESKAFAIFDEPRCRGSDLKLKRDAVALLTLGPGMCKDKLMQAAGRMRQLERGQKLIITGGKEVWDEIRRCSEGKRGTRFRKSSVGPKKVLVWAMHNTVAATAKGIPSWADQGMFFNATLGKPELSVLDENAALSHFYGSALEERTVADAAISSREFHLQRRGDAVMEDETKDMIERIQSRSEMLGQDFHVSTSGADEECERELELEVEEEEEIEVEIPRKVPRIENDWNYKAIFKANSPSQLPTASIALTEVIKRHATEQLGKLHWCPNVYVTQNFMNSVSDMVQLEDSSSSHYLRLVDTAIFFNNGKELLLVSEREADHILPLFWERATDRLSCTFLHHSSLRRWADSSGCGKVVLTLPTSAPGFLGFLGQSVVCCDDDMIASVQLFAGETMYRTKTRKEALKKILFCNKRVSPGLSITEASGNPDAIVAMRGSGAHFPYSDLERVCEEIACDLTALLAAAAAERP